MLQSREGLYSQSKSDNRFEELKGLFCLGFLGKASAPIPKQII